MNDFITPEQKKTIRKFYVDFLDKRKSSIQGDMIWDILISDFEKAFSDILQDLIPE